jgi:hypothetical protein
MKPLLLLIAAATLALGQAAPIRYSLRDIPADDPRLTAAFESVAAWNTKRAKEYGGPVSYPIPAPAPGTVETEASARARDYRARGLSMGGSDYKTTKTPRTEKPPTDLAEFLQRLKAGETFLIEKGTATTQCKPCTGSGKIIPADRRLRGPDGKQACAPCKATGKITSPQQVLILW